MKKIEAVVRHFKVEEIKDALVQEGIHGMSVTEVRGYGLQKGHNEHYRAAEYTVDFVQKSKIEVVVPDEALASTVNTILRVGRTGAIGDGKIFITALEHVVRIRTGEQGAEAV